MNNDDDLLRTSLAAYNARRDAERSEGGWLLVATLVAFALAGAWMYWS